MSGAMRRGARMLRLGLALGLSASLPGLMRDAAAQPPPPIRDFFRTPTLSQPVLSPSGRLLAAGIAADGGRVRLVVLDMDDLKASRQIASFQDADVNSIRWVNEGRLVFSALDRQSGSGQAMAPGLWAVNADGSDFRRLIHSRSNFISNGSTAEDRTLPWEWRLHSVLADGSDDVLVQGISHNNGEILSINLARLNTRTGRQTNLVQGAPDHLFNWLTDSQGRIAAASGWHEGQYFSYLREADGSWKRWQAGGLYDYKYAEPFWASDDGLLVARATGPTGMSALFELDRASGKLDAKPLVSLAGYDFTGEIVYDPQARRVLGAHYETDALGTAWFAPEMRAVQAAVDALLPATVNTLSCRNCLSARRLLVTSVSDTQPPLYHVYEQGSKALTLLSSARPWIKPQQMGRRDVFRYAARDGLQIPVLVTHPPAQAQAPRPAVLLVHGGPWVRGNHWAWDAEAQLLASRGYVVIEPEFRGSTGYGFKHFKAGWKQWGLAMQDDLADAVQWAAAKGLIDPRRVCIAGASYGGYAVLMGLAKHHDVYQCGINWVGVSDIQLMYSISWSDFSEDWKQFGMPLLVGDREKDARQLDETSPLAQAARVRRPLLMAYGGADYRVPIKHGTAFRDAVAPTNKNVEWVVYPEEGHGWRMLETNEDFWGRALRLLDAQIGAPR